MKKLLALVAAMSLLMVGCSSPAESSTAPAGDASTDAPAESIEIIVAHNNTSLESPYAKGAIAFEETLEEISGGQVQVVLHHGTLGENENELVEKLTIGATDMVVAAPAFMSGIGVPEIDIFSLLYLFDSFDHWEASMDGEFGQAMQQFILDKTNNQFRVMGYWSSGVRDVYANRAITSTADVEGMAIRTQDSAVQQQFWTDAGATPTSVAWSELYQALQQGVVDGAENDYTNLRLKDHHNTPNGKYISETHHDYTTRFFMMTDAFYNSLTDEQKAWVDEASVAATAAERQATYDMFEESKEICIADGAIVTNHEDINIEEFKAIGIAIQDQFAEQYGMQDYFAMLR